MCSNYYDHKAPCKANGNSKKFSASKNSGTCVNTTGAAETCRNICYTREYWSTNYTIDRLKQHLAKVTYYETTPDGRSVESRKYYNQVFRMLKIGAFNPPPCFIISLSDFDNDPRLLEEFHQLDKETLGYILLQAVARMFEDVNSKLYHNSISKVLKVKLEK
jgi:hypothetical protein